MSQIPKEARHPFSSTILTEQADAGVTHIEAAPSFDRKSQDVFDENAQGATVGDGDNQFTGMPGGDAVDGGNDAFQQVPLTLAAWDNIVRVAGSVLSPLFGVQSVYIGFHQSLENAETSLAQSGVLSQHMMVRSGDQLRRVSGPTQIGTVQRGTCVHGTNPRRQGPGLSDALGRQGTVHLALIDATRVEFCLPVAYEQDLTSRHVLK